MIEETKPIRKRKSYAMPNSAESGMDIDRTFGNPMSSSHYYAWLSSQWFN